MKLGQIKAEAIMLMYPSANVKFDDTDDNSINNAIFELKCDSNLEGILEAAIGSINRAFAYIEACGLSNLKYSDIPSSECQRISGGKAKIPLEADFLSLEELVKICGKHTESCDYRVYKDYIITDYCDSAYSLSYRASIERISRKTSDSYEISLPSGVCEAIPYFIKADLFSTDNEAEAKEAREVFDGMIERLRENAQPVCREIKTVYAV